MLGVLQLGSAQLGALTASSTPAVTAEPQFRVAITAQPWIVSITTT